MKKWIYSVFGTKLFIRTFMILAAFFALHFLSYRTINMSKNTIPLTLLILFTCIKIFL